MLILFLKLIYKLFLPVPGIINIICAIRVNRTHPWNKNMIRVHPWLWLNMMIHDLNQFWWMCPSLKSIKSILMICAHPLMWFAPIMAHVNRSHSWNKYDSCPSLTKHDDSRFESILMNVPIPEINKIDFNNFYPSHYSCPSLNMIRANHVNRVHSWNKYDPCPSLTKHDDSQFESILMNVPIPEINKIPS